MRKPTPSFYDPEFNEDGSEKHVTCNFARYHVVSYIGHVDGSYEQCSEPNCEINRRRELAAKPTDTAQADNLKRLHARWLHWTAYVLATVGCTHELVRVIAGETPPEPGEIWGETKGEVK